MERTRVADATQPGSNLDRRVEALFAVLYIHTQVVRPVDDALERAHGTNVTGFELLARLSRMRPEGASVRYLADQVVVSPSRVSRMADEFVGRGLLERALSHQDGRLSLLRLTARGRDELKAIEATFTAAISVHFLDRLADEQVQALIDIGRSLGAPHCQAQ